MGLLATASITTQNLNPTSGVPTAGSTVALASDGDVTGYNYDDIDTLSIQVTGTYTGALTPQVTTDGVNWVALGASALLNANLNTNSATIASAVVGVFIVNVAGFRGFRLTALAAMTGTAVVSFSATKSTGAVTVTNALPTGSNTIGAFNLGTGGTTATSLGKAEDAVHATGDTGVEVLGVRVPAATAQQATTAQ